MTALFNRALSRGLDPETRVATGAYEEATLFYAATYAGNFDAAMELLNAGASPHAFQKLDGSRKAAPFFLFPVHHVATSSHFSAQEKKQLISKMFEQNPTFHEAMKLSTTLTPFQTGDSTVIVPRDVLGKVFQFTSEQPTRPSLSCSIERDISPCAHTKDRTRNDWCEFSKAVPAVIDVFDIGISDIRVAYVQNLISISDGRAYFFVTQLHGSQSINGVLEALPEDGSYRLYTYGNAGDKIRGACRGQNGWDPMSYCWRFFEIDVSPDLTARIDNSFDARAIPACKD
jgi:hypothetical protein